MTDIAKVVEEIALAHEYDPVKAHEYYLRTRKLKGRKLGTQQNPQSGFKKSASSMPKSVLKKTPRRIEEDEVPAKSPSGAKIVDYDGKGPGKATYADGSTFDGNGWTQPTSKAAAKTSVTKAKQLNDAQRKLSAARAAAKKLPPDRRNAVEKKIDAAQKKLNKLNPFKTEKRVETRVIPKAPKITSPPTDLPARVAKVKKQLADARKAAEKEKKSPLGKLRAFEKRVDAIEKKLNKKAIDAAKKPFKSDKEWVNKQIRKDPNGWVANMERMKAKQARRKAATNDRQR